VPFYIVYHSDSCLFANHLSSVHVNTCTTQQAVYIDPQNCITTSKHQHNNSLKLQLCEKHVVAMETMVIRLEKNTHHK